MISIHCIFRVVFDYFLRHSEIILIGLGCADRIVYLLLSVFVPKFVLTWDFSNYFRKFCSLRENLLFQEVPIESFGNDKTPLMVALEFDAIPFFILLLRYGAKLYLNKDLFEFKSEKNKMEIEMYLVRCGWTPTRSTVPSSLKFCSKLTIRRALFNAWNLPNGIPKLYLPKELERYLNLEIDWKNFISIKILILFLLKLIFHGEWCVPLSWLYLE